MSAAKAPISFRGLLTSIVAGIFGWLLIAPISTVVPKRRDWMAVIGRDGGKFLDNSKYFFLQSAQELEHNVRIVFVTEHRHVAEMLRRAHYETMIYPSLRSMFYLIRSGSLVVDSADWYSHLRRFLLIRAKVVQLWHGVGFKRIEIDKWRLERPEAGRLFSPRLLFARLFVYRLTGRLVRYAIVNTTSVFYRDKVFAPAFVAQHYLTAGYPRNTFGECGSKRTSGAAWLNVDPLVAQLIPQWQKAKRKIVLVAPTFRETRTAPMGLTSGIREKLDYFCATSGLELVFKFHPYEPNLQDIHGLHIHVCESDSDIYPLLPLSSCLITDYSSIYMDYLHVDRPILFFVPDLEEYGHIDRQLQFDFDTMTPGPKLTTWDQVVDQLQVQMQQDAYAGARRDLRRLAFDNLNQHEAVPKLLEFMRARRWLPDTRTAGSRTTSLSNG